MQAISVRRPSGVAEQEEEEGWEEEEDYEKHEVVQSKKRFSAFRSLPLLPTFHFFLPYSDQPPPTSGRPGNAILL